MQTCLSYNQQTILTNQFLPALLAPLGGHFLGLPNPVRDVGAGGGDLPLHILTPDGKFLH